MKRIILLLTLALLITSCNTTPNNNLPKDFCASDSDCMAGGCSGQLCGSKKDLQGVITTCEWKEIYSCYKLTSCSCINNQCQWQQTNEFKNCLSKH